MRSTILASTILISLGSYLSTAAPLPKSEFQPPSDCSYKTCLPRLQLVDAGPHPPPPSGPVDLIQIEIEITERIRKIDNSIFTPSSSTPASKALDMHRPLSSTYLQSLSKAAQSLEEKVSDYLSTHPATSSTSIKSSSKSHSKVHKPCHKKEGHVYLPGNVYITTHEYISRKPDAAIVGAVLMFLVMVVLAECVDRIVTAVREKRARSLEERGQIYLEEDNGEIRIIGEGISVVAWEEDVKDPLVYEIEV